MLIFGSSYSKNPEIKIYSVVLFIDNNNNKMFLEQQINLIRMISEGSRDMKPGVMMLKI